MLVKQIVNSKRVKIGDIAKVLRTFEAAVPRPSIKNGRPHLLSLQKLKNSTLLKCFGNYDGFYKLEEESIKKLTWWVNDLNSSNKTDMPNSKFIVFPIAGVLLMRMTQLGVVGQKKNHSYILRCWK